MTLNALFSLTWFLCVPLFAAPSTQSVAAAQPLQLRAMPPAQYHFRWAVGYQTASTTSRSSTKSTPKAGALQRRAAQRRAAQAKARSRRLRRRLAQAPQERITPPRRPSARSSSRTAPTPANSRTAPTPARRSTSRPVARPPASRDDATQAPVPRFPIAPNKRDGLSPPPPPPPPGTTAMVGAIRFVGLRHIKASLVRRWIFLQEGEPFVRKTMMGDLRRLRKTGYFAQISARVTTSQDLVTVTYVFKERGGRINAVYFLRNTLYTQEQLITQLQLQPGAYFNRTLLAEDARQLLKVYHSIGHFRARVTVQGRWQKQSLTLWFTIDEGQPASIRRVSLRGNQKFSSDTLRELLHSRTPSVGSWFSGKGFFHPSFVAYDLYLLRNFYYDRGHLQNKITGPKIEVSRDRRWATLTYTIVEGPEFRYGKISFVGDLIQPDQALRKRLTFKPGDVFNRTALYRLNVLRFQQMYQDAGYYYTRIQTVPRIGADRKVHLQFYIIKGPMVRVERIEIKGNTSTRDGVIRRLILLKEGAPFHATRLHQSRLLILSTGYFEQTDPSLGIKVVISKGSAEDRVILRFTVKEKSTLLYNFGFNYLPIEGFVIAGQFGQRNFLGNGQTLLGGGVISTTLRLWRIFAYFIEPQLFGSQLYTSLSGYVSHHDTSSSVNAGFIRDTQGGRLTLSHPLFHPRLRISLGYRVERVTLSPAGKLTLQVPIANYFSTRTASALQLSLRWDSRNRAINATKGLVLFGSYEHAAPYLGADYTLHRFEAGGRLFVPLPWKMVLKFAVTAGWSLSPDADGVLPFERFPHDGSYFLVRGYLPFSLGPLRGVPSLSDPAFKRSALNWGGTKKFILNAEFEVPIVRIPQLPISIVIFFDAGNAYESYEYMFQDTRNPGLLLGLYTNLGFGIRMQLPNVGVMRFEFGFPLNPRPGDPIPVFNFQVGEAF